ncbi:MAG: hypothetical protein LQ344_003561 [Seirophora lacunosa]|nr:MAG: hypothetical protein LQ344_003561 [Seirophora lacunosa]
MTEDIIATICLAWYLFILAVCAIGITQIHDVRILVEEEDPNLSGRSGNVNNLGPNPKIRNMSRAYREAKGDIVWIIDCNVWVDRSTAGRLVDLLCGFAPGSRGRKYKFVHQLPLAIDISHRSDLDAPSKDPHPSEYRARAPTSKLASAMSCLGGRLEEMFLSTSHAKFYTAIAAVAVAPCTVGKSNMFRRSHLNALTASASYRDPGIDFFSENICEDHLISDLMWKQPVPEEVCLAAQKEGRDPQSPLKQDSVSAKWGCQQINGMESKSFEEALTDLEMVVDIGFKLDSDNFLDFEEFYYRKLNLVLETDRNSLYHDLTSKQTLRYLQRLTAIQAKLREYMSKHTAERMNTLVTTCLYATIKASDQAVNIPVTALALGVEVSLIQAGRPQ